MTSQAQSLEYLRSLMGGIEKPLIRERQPFSLLPEGLPRGALVEITGPGKTEATVLFLAEHKKIRAAWVEEKMTVYPTAILQKQVALNRILFVEAQHEVVWALLQVLRSQLFECIVTSIQNPISEKNLRRLQLGVEKANIFFFLLTEKPLRAWPVSQQLQVERNARRLCFV